ncbi:MAG: formylglycine-generating enzyme family protein [Nitrospirota bacterium]
MNTHWMKWTTEAAIIATGLLLIVSSSRGQTAMPMDPSLFPNETCKKCHTSAGPPQVDYSKPECVECHSALDEEGLIPIADRPPGRHGKQPAEISAAPNELILVPAGEFIIGNNGRGATEGAGDPDEMPGHKTYLDAFLIDKYEVTNAQYKAFVDATNHRSPKLWRPAQPAGTARPGDGSERGITYPLEKGTHPVVYVDWYDANEYCRWTGKRLPTEEEWEKAARGTDGRIFPWGNAYDVKKANSPQYWLSLNKEGDTLPVGSFENGRSPYGLYDMAGNVYEWTAAWYKPYPRNTEFNAHYGEKNKIVRGGSWYDCLSYGCGLSAPSSNRSRFAPEIRNKGFGFRCAKSQ